MKTYKASMDSVCKIITLVVMVILAIAFISSLTYSLSSEDSERWATLLLFAALFVIFGVTYLLAPRAYQLSTDTLTIDRLWAPVHIPLQQIAEVSTPPLNQFNYAVRLFGSGGFLGYFGLFWVSKTGRMWWYATQRRNVIMVILKEGHPIIITPDDFSLAEELKKHISSAPL